MKRFRGTKGIIILVMMMVLVIGYFYYLSNRPVSSDNKTATVNTEKISPVDTVLLRNLDINYPATPKEVVKYYAELTKVLYNEEYTDEEFQALAVKIQQLYDPELVANKEQSEYLQDLKDEIEAFHTNKWTISTYWTSSSTDVERFTEDGYEFARLYCTFTIRQSGGSGSSNEVFLLRKDENEHWKIYGWKQVQKFE